MSLEAREKKFLGIGAIAFVLIVAIWLVTGGDSGTRGGDSKRVAQKQETFHKDLKDYLEIKDSVEKIDQRLSKTPENFDLAGELNEIFDSLGIKNAIRSLNPTDAGANDFYSASYVDIKIDEISLDDLVSLLVKIESSDAFIKVDKLTVRRRFKDNALDINIRVAAYSAKLEEAPPK